MKALLAILAISGLMAFTYQGPDNKEIAGLLNNPQTRQEIFRSIRGNQKLLSEFMQEMHGNWQNMSVMENQKDGSDYMINLMHSNPGVMHNMINNMIGACATDSVMGRDLINSMSHYPGMMNMMNGYMYHHGMMGTYGNGMMMGGNNRTMMHSSGNNQ